MCWKRKTNKCTIICHQLTTSVCKRKRQRFSRWILEYHQSTTQFSSIHSVNRHILILYIHIGSSCPRQIKLSVQTIPFSWTPSYCHVNKPTKACATSVKPLVRQWKKPHTTNNKCCRTTWQTQQWHSLAAHRGRILLRKSE